MPAPATLIRLYKFLKNDRNIQRDLAELVYEVSLTVYMVEVNGIEPMTPCLQSRCSPS